MTTQKQDCDALRHRIQEETIAESYREDTGPMFFPNGDKWTGYVESDIFGNRYYEAISRKSGQPYRVTSAPAQRLF
jgi:hypothetical protein